MGCMDCNANSSYFLRRIFIFDTVFVFVQALFCIIDTCALSSLLFCNSLTGKDSPPEELVLVYFNFYFINFTCVLISWVGL